MFGFERLEGWERAISFADAADSITREFPSYERFRRINQMRRAPVSLPSNIPEGSVRNSRRDFARFVGITAGSIVEVVSQAFISRNQGLVSQDGFHSVCLDSVEPAVMLGGLRRSLFEDA